MINKIVGNIGRTILAISMVSLGTSVSLRADDTEIYQYNYNAGSTGRPKVLIVIDDSGSMGRVDNDQDDKPPYDPNETYVSQFDSSRIYWSTDGSPPPANTTQYFLSSKNRCDESVDSLANQGKISSKFRRWIDSTTVEECTSSCPSGYSPFFGSCIRFSPFSIIPPTQQCQNVEVPGYWDALNADDPDPRHVECRDDVTNSNPLNPGTISGYPKDNVITSLAYSASTPTQSDVDWGNESYTLYSAHYMDWAYDTTLVDNRTRMAIAQDVITSLIQANKGIDFGLVEFNGNWSAAPASNGGRVVSRIIENMTLAQRANVVNMVNTMTASGSTPMCEASYEAYRYLAGKSVLYGYTDDGTRNGDLLVRDPLAINSSGNYISPADDCAYTYVVIMTDGLPQNDTDANSAIETLIQTVTPGKTCNDYPSDGQGNTKNCLPELAEYMFNNDLDGDTTNGIQRARTYTIGLSLAQDLLVDAATLGGGESYVAYSASELSAAFENAILSILSTDSTFTSPAVAVDTFSRTQSRDEVFYAMFRPDERVDWPGNIKKLKLSISGGNAILVDKNNAAAIDPDTGFIKDTASTFWATAPDGPSVSAGGVGGLLAARDQSTRAIYTNSGTGGALEAFNNTNLDRTAFGFTTDDELWTFFDVSNQAQLDAVIEYGKGYDVYDEDDDDITSETRPWVLADILHSQPLVVNYGALGSATQADPDLRLVVGTNAGFVHMFGSDDGQEDWAFFPKELGPVLRARGINNVSSDHVYGVDASPVLYTRDNNRDGTINSASPDFDKAYVFLNLRRGGRAMYGLDISNPGSPAFLWKIDHTMTGFTELGQTWSTPVVTRIPGYVDSDGKPKPVLVFGAGYDTNKDGTGVATADSMGRGIFVVDAETGVLIWSVSPAANSTTNLQETGLAHSVAASVATLDSNGDELADRIYFGDTGGNLWRVDMPGNALPTSSQDTWRIVQMADMNGSTLATDRRFFNAPDIVRTKDGDLAFDAVLIGTGDRTNPNATDVSNQFYMIRDQRLLPYFTPEPTTGECTSTTDPIDDFRCGLPLTPSSLYDVTDNLIQLGTTTEQQAAAAALATAAGWRLDMNQGTGEKNLAKSLTIAGTVYFTSFAPDTSSTIQCEPIPGFGRLYAVNLLNAKELVDFDNDNDTERSWIIGNLIPDTPSAHFGSDGEIRLLLPPGSDIANPFLTGATVPDPYSSYWYREEY